ncbi:peptidoglycan DD-metalloendopeptidase family protein [Enterococcus faecium]
MKKTNISKVASILLLSQICLSAPTQALAEEQLLFQDDEKRIQETQKDKNDYLPNPTDNLIAETEDTTSNDSATNTTQTETSADNSPTDNSSQSTTETTDDTTDSTTDQPQTDSESSKPTDSSQQDNTNQEESTPSETPSSEEPSISTDSSSTQEEITTETSESTATSESQEITASMSQPVVSETQQVPRPALASQEESTDYHQETTSPIEEIIRYSKKADKGTIHFEKDESVESFVRKIGESARKVGQENDLYASVMIAQAIIESASGQSELAQAPNYNLFGIKGTHNGKSVSFATQEDFGNGTFYTTQATFKRYETYEDSLNDYVKLLKEGLIGNSNYYSGVWKSNTKTYQEATEFLTGRYATDTQYDEKLNALIEAYHLTDYDKEVAGPELSQKGYIVPVKNYTISSPFGDRDGEFHRGLDFAAAQGEPIYASKAGTVIKAEFHSSWGNYVAIEHEDGTTALYAHQQEYQVKIGDKVEQGQIIGYVGSTGNSTGPHLHFEICLNNSLNQSQLIDPQTVLTIK